MNSKFFIACAAMFGFSAVAIGAFAAHGLKSHLSEYALGIIDTGVKYQMFHTLVILALGLFVYQRYENLNKAKKPLVVALYLFSVGIVFFSGSLYLLAISEIKVFAYFTPIGGLCLLLAWASVLLASIKLEKQDTAL